jgi:hypothetical protein
MVHFVCYKTLDYRDFALRLCGSRAAWKSCLMEGTDMMLRLIFLGNCSRISLAIFGACLWLNCSVARANLLTNGSFESGSYSFGGDGAQDLLPGSTTITGWTVITNHVAPIEAANVYSIIPEDGNVSLDLQGYSDSAPYGGVQQTVATVPGAQYQLSFWIGVQNSISYAVGPASVQATAGSASQSFTNILSGAGNQWEQFSMDFSAPSASTIVTLSGVSTEGLGYIGLDNADLELVPEPGSLVLLLVGSSLWLKRRERSR